MLAAAAAAVAGEGESIAAPVLTAAQIAEKNVAARGGLDAWRKIQTVVFVGHLETSKPGAPFVPFVLQLKRPNKRHFEVRVQEERSVRIFDGTKGWKVRPSHGRIPELVPFTADEVSAARDAPGIDGPLFDSAAKGVAIHFDRLDEVEGRKAYRLSLTLPSGATQHAWIDAKSFLDVQYDRESHNTTGQTATVTVHQRDYKTVSGLQIPHTIEIGGERGKGAERMVIDRVLLNPPLGDDVFERPSVPMRRTAPRRDGAATLTQPGRFVQPPPAPSPPPSAEPR